MSFFFHSVIYPITVAVRMIDGLARFCYGVAKEGSRAP